MKDPNASPDRPTVRVCPMDLPRELLDAGATCAQCEQRPRTRDAFMVFVDRARDDRAQVKSQAFLACSKACADELEAGLTVEYSMLGVTEVRSSEAAVALANGEAVPEGEIVHRDEDGYELSDDDDDDDDDTIGATPEEAEEADGEANDDSD